MERISHITVMVNGIESIDMHIADMVILLHGFPELWYSWRHQIFALSSLGYHAVAPDIRGFSNTEAPPSTSSYSCLQLVGVLIEFIDHLGVEQVFLVAHDWGAVIGWFLCLFRPDRVKAYVCLSVIYRPRNPKIKPVETMKLAFGEDYYVCRFQEPGVIEAGIERAGTAEVIKKISTDRNPGPPCLPKENLFGIYQENPVTLPSLLAEEDLAFYVKKFNQKGFTGGLNYYRALDLNWELTAPWTGALVKVPVKFVVGDLDTVFTTPEVKEFVNNGGFKHRVLFLEDVVVMEGVGHSLTKRRQRRSTITFTTALANTDLFCAVQKRIQNHILQPSTLWGIPWIEELGFRARDYQTGITLLCCNLLIDKKKIVLTR